MLEPPTRLTVWGLLAGAVLGTVARYATVTAWPGAGQALTTTLITSGLACVVLGLMTATGRQRVIAASVVGFAGSFASVGIVAVSAIASRPAWCGAYVLLTPITAIAGLALGLMLGVHCHSKAQAVVDRV